MTLRLLIVIALLSLPRAVRGDDWIKVSDSGSVWFIHEMSYEEMYENINRPQGLMSPTYFVASGVPPTRFWNTRCTIPNAKPGYYECFYLHGQPHMSLHSDLKGAP